MREPYENPMSAIAIASASGVVTLSTPSVLFVGGAGKIKVVSALNSGTVTFNNMAAGTFMPLVCKKIVFTSGATTCSGIIALW